MMVSANNTLERLDVSGNNLGNDYFSRCIGPALKTNQSVKSLKFSSCGSNDVSAICEALVEGNSTIKELDASNNHVGAVFGQGLSNILRVIWDDGSLPACLICTFLQLYSFNISSPLLYQFLVTW